MSVVTRPWGGAKPVLFIDIGANVRHATVTVSSVKLDLISEVASTEAPDSIGRVRIVVTNAAAMRVRLNGNSTAIIDADNGIYVDFEHPLDVSGLAITAVEGIVTGSTDATAEITMFW